MNNNFSENLKKIRKDNNLSQEQLAEELGVSRQAISKWESALAYPEMDKIIALSDKFNLNIDDLLHKDIREIKGEEETKKNLNQYVDDFLNFITNTINMFSNMSFKSKIKCLLEQFVIGLILFIIFGIAGAIGRDLLSNIFEFIPDRIYFVFGSIIILIYVIFGFIVSLLIMLHIFKTRYLDYYEKIKQDVINEEELQEKNKKIEDLEKMKTEKTNKNNKILFQKDERKIIIRDPKHSEYKFISGISKIILSIIKFFTLCFALLLFVSLIFLVFGFVISFLIYKTGLFFVGLLLLFLALIVINIDCILVVLNFIFNRKNDKKKIIWSIIISLVFIGIGTGMLSIGTLNLEYIENDKIPLKTDYLEFDMIDGLFIDAYDDTKIEYIESNIDNIKVEYQVNELCDIDYSYFSKNDSAVHIWGYCSNPIKLINGIVNYLNDKKILTIDNGVHLIKIYATKENIDKLKNNRKIYYGEIESNNNLINSYENRIDELQQKVDEYAQKEWEYEQKISILKDQLVKYENIE